MSIWSAYEGTAAAARHRRRAADPRASNRPVDAPPAQRCDRLRLRPCRHSRCLSPELPPLADAAGAAASGPGAVQNPPQFPTLAVTWWSLRRRGVRFVIDWHNLGYTLLQLRLGGWHPAVRLARWFERRDARRVDGNLCVSRALAAFLESRFGVRNARVLYDRPASVFVPLRARRARTVPSGAVRAARHSRPGRRLHRLPDELDRRRGLRRRHRRRACGWKSGSAAGKRRIRRGGFRIW